MGNVCQENNIHELSNLEKGDESTKLGQFKEIYWPDDNFLLDRIERLKNDDEYSSLLEKEKLRKHKVKNQYYLGQWDANGYQKGRGILYNPGNYFYVGEFDSNPHGHGTLQVIKEGYIYEGEFKHGKAEGKGKLTSQDNKYKFEGIINSDSTPTHGILRVNIQEDKTKSYQIKFEDYPNNKATINYDDGRQYVGYLNSRNYVPEGEGTARFPDGSIYQGGWLQGQTHGQGTFTWTDGSSYVGGYELGKKQGHGRFKFASGKVYEGDWHDGKQNGRGKLLGKNGEELKKGIWRQGVFAVAD